MGDLMVLREVKKDFTIHNNLDIENLLNIKFYYF
jgi:hypothetical protein